MAIVLFAKCYCLASCDKTCTSIVDDEPRLALKLNLTARKEREYEPLTSSAFHLALQGVTEATEEKGNNPVSDSGQFRTFDLASLTAVKGDKNESADDDGDSVRKNLEVAFLLPASPPAEEGKTAAVSPAPAGPAKETATVPLTPEKATVATAALKSILKPAKKP